MASHLLVRLALLATAFAVVLGARVAQQEADSAAAPPPQGGRSAASAVEALPEFRRARWVRVDRAAAQYQIRLAVLRSGKMLLVPQPKLRTGLLAVVDPTKIDPAEYAQAATLSGLKKYGEPIEAGTELSVDLIVVGSAAVNPTTGERCDRPGSTTNLEFGMLREMKAVSSNTVVVTNVRGLQLVTDSPTERSLCHDLPADIICTPAKTIRVKGSLSSPTRRYWDKLRSRTESRKALGELTARSEAELDDLAAWEQAIRKRAGKREMKQADLEAAARLLEELPEFERALYVRVGPGEALAEMRLAVLRAGKVLVVPEARMKTLRVLRPAAVDPSRYADAVTEDGVAEFGERLKATKGLQIDLFVIGSAAVSPSTGARVAPSEENSDLEDLEYGLLRQVHAVDGETPVVTTVHDRALLEEVDSERMLPHQVSASIICTPTTTIRIERVSRNPAGLHWHAVSPQALQSSAPLREVKAKIEKELRLRLPPASPRGASKRAGGRKARAAAASQPAASASRSGKGGLRAGTGAAKAGKQQESAAAIATRSGKGGLKKAAAAEAARPAAATRSGKGGLKQDAVASQASPAPSAQTGKRGAKKAMAEKPAPAKPLASTRSGKGGRTQTDASPEPATRSGKGGGKKAVVEKPAPAQPATPIRSGKGGREQTDATPEPATRSGKGGEKKAVVEKPAPVELATPARSGKGGRARMDAAPELATRSRKGGAKKAVVEKPAPAQPSTATRSGKGGRAQTDAAPEPAMRSGKGGEKKAVVEKPTPVEPAAAARSGKGGRAQTVAAPKPAARSSKSGRR